MKLKDVLKGKLTKKELELVPRSFDIVGDVAIIEIPRGLGKRKRIIADALRSLHPRIKTVCSKKGERTGDFRLRPLQVLLGKETRTEHVESGCRFRLDLRDSYFSGREGTERRRVAGQVKRGEHVLVMFSGVGPFAIVIAKTQPAVGKVHALEINKKAHESALENVRINRVQAKVVPVCGDVRRVCPKLKQKFDRIVMPLPKGAHDFLDVAFRCVKKGGMIHLYHVDSEEDLYSAALKMIKKAALHAGKKVKVVNLQRVLPYGPRAWKICIDFRVA